MKKPLLIVLTLAMLLSLCACGGGSKNVELGESVEKGVGKITITDVQLANTRYVKANKNSDDFLMPIAKEDLQLGDNFIKATSEDKGVAVITMIVENIGKSDWNVKPSDYVINYDNGNRYSSDSGYALTSDGWSEFETLTLEKVTSGATEVRIAVWVPNVIIEDTASLTLDFHGFSCKIR